MSSLFVFKLSSLGLDAQFLNIAEKTAIDKLKNCETMCVLPDCEGGNVASICFLILCPNLRASLFFPEVKRSSGSTSAALRAAAAAEAASTRPASAGIFGFN